MFVERGGIMFEVDLFITYISISITISPLLCKSFHNVMYAFVL